MTDATTFSPLADDLQLAAELVTAAGDLALRMRSEGLQGERKTSVSDVVTAADHAAEALVKETLARRRPADGVFGEEGTDSPGTSGRTWVIDPVDGTYNFLQGSPYWCSAIALRDDSTPDAATSADPGVLLGAVYQPQTGRLWVGGDGHPTTLNGAPVRVTEDVGAGMLSLGSYLHPTRYFDDDILQPWRHAASRAATVRMLGSGSTDLGSVSTGELGYWFQLACPQWDWLPGKALVRAAGGVTRVVTLPGSLDDGRALNWFIAGPPRAVAETADALLGNS